MPLIPVLAIPSFVLGMGLAALPLLAPTPAHAQMHAQMQSTSLRAIPLKATPGVLELKIFPEAVLDDSPIRLSAGARIHDLDNRIVMPASLTGSTHRVLFTKDMSGSVDRVWLATEAEFDAAKARRR